jgi:hypothetical protein
VAEVGVEIGHLVGGIVEKFVGRAKLIDDVVGLIFEFENGAIKFCLFQLTRANELDQMGVSSA